MKTTLLTTNKIEDLDFSQLEIGSQFVQVTPTPGYDIHNSVMLTDIYRDCLYVFRSLVIEYHQNRSNGIEVEHTTYLRMDDNIIQVHKDMSESINRDNFFLSMSGTVDQAINDGKVLGKVLTFNDNHVWYCAVPFKTIPNKYLVMETRVQLQHPSILVTHHFGILDPNHHFSITFGVDNPEELFQFVRLKIQSSEYEKYRTKLLYPLLYTMQNYIEGVPPDNFKKLFNGSDIDKYFQPVFKHNDFEIYADYYNFKMIHTYKGMITSVMSPEYTRISDTLASFYFTSREQINPFTCEVIDKNVDGITFQDVGGIEVQQGRAFSYYIPIYDIFVQATKEEAQDIIDRKKIINKLTT